MLQRLFLDWESEKIVFNASKRKRNRESVLEKERGLFDKTETHFEHAIMPATTIHLLPSICRPGTNIELKKSYSEDHD